MYIRGRIVLISVLVAVGLIIIYFVFSIDKGASVLAQHEAALRADTYGGSSPEETLQLFVAALRAENVELAARYFMYDDNLSRVQWIERLQGLKEKQLLARMADDIEEFARSATPHYDGDAGYELLNSDGTVAVIIDMELNPFSNVWKIQRF